MGSDTLRTTNNIYPTLKVILLACLVFAVVSFSLRSIVAFPVSGQARNALVRSQLLALEVAIKEKDAAIEMQALFPEGACFTITLYALAWSNLSSQFPQDTSLRNRAQGEMAWSFAQYEKSYVNYPFSDTQISKGVFWFGQQNLVLGRYLESLEETERPSELVSRFNTNCQVLAAQFLESPTHHLDTYPGQCWPADNMTALASLFIHDRLYGSHYQEAYYSWKHWTLNHLDPATGLPAGQLDSRTGQLYEPARGCANAWMIPLIAKTDTLYARELYELYKEQFQISHLGFKMFREYPPGSNMRANVDSGPIIWDAGVVATGAGLAGAINMGDMETSRDIHNLVSMFAWPRMVSIKGERGTEYLLGRLPMGDAFMTWVYSQPQIMKTSSDDSPFFQRIIFYSALLIILFILVARFLSVLRLIIVKHEKRDLDGTLE